MIDAEHTSRPPAEMQPVPLARPTACSTMAPLFSFQPHMAVNAM